MARHLRRQVEGRRRQGAPSRPDLSLSPVRPADPLLPSKPTSIGTPQVPDGRWQPKGALDCLRKAMRWYEVLQADDGHWAGDYGGPMFLMPGLVTVWYVTGKPESVISVLLTKARRGGLRDRTSVVAVAAAPTAHATIKLVIDFDDT